MVSTMPHLTLSCLAPSHCQPSPARCLPCNLQIQSYDAPTARHRIKYRDGDVQNLVLAHEAIIYLEKGSPTPTRPGREGKPPSPATGGGTAAAARGPRGRKRARSVGGDGEESGGEDPHDDAEHVATKPKASRGGGAGAREDGGPRTASPTRKGHKHAAESSGDPSSAEASEGDEEEEEEEEEEGVEGEEEEEEEEDDDDGEHGWGVCALLNCLLMAS
jgi:hypothetical protein